METGNTSQSNNGAQLPKSQEQLREWEQFTDIGLCVLVCDCKVKGLLECVVAHAFSQKNNDVEVASFAKELAQGIEKIKRKQLKQKLIDRFGKKANVPKDPKKKMDNLTLYELQCLVEALGEDKDGLIKTLRETRNDVVHTHYKFEQDSGRKNFLNTYKKFIDKFDFEKYFGSSHAETKRKKYLETSVNYENLTEVLPGYNDIHDKWEKERDQLKEQVKEMEEQLKEEKGERNQLEQKLDEKKWELSKKDQQIEQLIKDQESMKEQLSELDKKLLLERDASREKDETISKLNQEMKRLTDQAEQDGDSITKLNEQIETLNGQVEALKEQLIGSQHDMDIHKTLEKQRAECEERYKQLKKQLEASEVERAQLSEQVDRLEKLLEEETAERSLPLQPQTQKLQNTEWEQLTDTGLCMVVCDSKVKDLLEQMLAHTLLKMSDEEVALMAEKLPKHMRADARKRLSKKLQETARRRKNEEELKVHISKTMGLYQLQCVVEALGEDEGGLVGKLRKKRNDVVHKNYKFKDESEREKFLATYDEFIAKFNFEKYFGFFHANAKEKFSQISRSYEDLVKMMSEYDHICEQLEKERDQLEKQVKTLEDVLEEQEEADKSRLKQVRDKMERKLSKKDQQIERIKEEQKSVREKLDEELQLERDALKEKEETISKLDEEKKTLENQMTKTKENIAGMEKQVETLNGKIATLEEQLSGSRYNVDELEEGMKRLTIQAGQDGDSITKLKEQIKTRDEQVEALEERLSRCRCNMELGQQLSENDKAMNKDGD